MDLKEFEKQKKELYKKFNTQDSKLLAYEVFIETKFGAVHVRAEYMPKYKIAAIYSRLKYKEKEDLKRFKTETGYNIDLYNSKYNVESKDPEFILDTLEDYLSNLEYLQQKPEAF